jgi:alpha-tubulin suppressor-like RCC1 family protein
MALFDRAPSFRQSLRVSAGRAGTVAALLLIACSETRITPPELVRIAQLSVDSPPTLIERGTRDTLTATARDLDGQTVVVPVVWRSSNEDVALFERGGVLVALDTGSTIISASSLGVTSTGVEFRVVWFGPAHIDAQPWSPSPARSLGAVIRDSLRVAVINPDSVPVPGAKVAFAITQGAGSVSPALATTNASGVATAQLTIGPDAGSNVVTASVVKDDGTPDPLVADNLVSFTIEGYEALAVQGGDAQSGLVLGDLPVQPSVRLVDATGAPRAGVPVTFTPTANGRVASPVVPTDANGIATPGTWTLGDIPGAQSLAATVEDATVTLAATATGSPIHYFPARVVAGAYATCALEPDGAVKCWGESPQNGGGTPAHNATPTMVAGGLTAASLLGGPTHFCAIIATADAWCWGGNALPDTLGATPSPSQPTEVQSDIQWTQVSPGAAHNCGLDVSQHAFCWGSNANGQLGDLSTTTRTTIRAVQGAFTFTQISSGAAHTCALSAGSALCWGGNQAGELGDGTTEGRTAPTAVAGGHVFQSVGAGQAFTCALSAQSRAYCWGALGGALSPTPITYTSAPDFVAIAVGGRHACALTADNDAYCWGDNASGQLGDSSFTPRASPTRVAGGFKFQQISAGFEHTCGLTSAGAVACWGRNRSGELGDNGAPARSMPKHVVLGVNP